MSQSGKDGDDEKVDFKDDFPSARDASPTNDTESDDDQKHSAGGISSTRKGSDQSKVFGIFPRIQPQGPPMIPTEMPYMRGYRNFFLGEVNFAGDLGLSTMLGVFVFPRWLDNAFARTSAKKMGLPVTLKFRGLNSIVKGSYAATFVLAIAAATSTAGIDLSGTENQIMATLAPSIHKEYLGRMYRGDEKVPEKNTKIGLLVGLPLAYGLFRDGWSVHMYHRIVPHLLPLRLLPLYVGLACMSGYTYNVWNGGRMRMAYERPKAA